MRIRLFMVALLIWVISPSPVVWAEDPPPPKVRRSYTARVNLEPSSGAKDQPEPTSTVRLPDTPLPGGSEGSISDQLAPGAAPAVLPPPPVRDTKTRPGERDADPWSLKPGESATQPSGWGWLADAVIKSSQATTSEDRVQDNPSDRLQNPFDRSDEDDATTPSAENRESDGTDRSESFGKNPSKSEKDTLRATVDGPALDADVGWSPVSGDQEETRNWNTAYDAARDSSKSVVGNAKESWTFSPPDGLNVEKGAQVGVVRSEGDLGVRETPVDDTRGEDTRDRSLFRNSQADANQSVPGPEDRLGGTESGLFSSTTPTLDSRSSAFGAASPTPSFGSLNAVDIQPSLSASAPSITPALTLPSQESSVPSLGGMGTEMDAHPKTLPW